MKELTPRINAGAWGFSIWDAFDWFHG